MTIATLTGDNGILTRAEEAKENMTQAEAEEMVELAIEALLTENLGDSSKITPEAIANQVMEDNSDVGNVRAEDSAFPTNIVFEENEIKVGVTSELKVGALESYGGIYSEPGLEGKIAPQELFNYEPISNAEISATTYDDLPTKEARITGIKPEYCNDNGGIDGSYDDTNYEIRYEGITDTLVVPYQIEIDGEMYKVTEVNATCQWKDGNTTGTGLPSIKTIIYPNTVKKISGLTNTAGEGIAGNDTHIIEKIVLSNNLESIEDCAFRGCTALTDIEIPSSVSSIGYGAFWRLQCINQYNHPINCDKYRK